MTRRAWFVLALLLASAGCGRGEPESRQLDEAAADSVSVEQNRTHAAPDTISDAELMFMLVNP